MNKRRKLSVVPVREPNGRLSRSTLDRVEACSPAEVRRLRDAALAGMRDEQWGTEAGRLFLDGKLTAPQFEAAKRWSRLASAASEALRGPKRAAKAASFVPKAGGQEPDPDTRAGQEIAAKERLVLQEFTEAHGALIGAGMLAEQAVRGICEDGRAVASHYELESFKRGLDWVALFWGLTQLSKNVRRD